MSLRVRRRRFLQVLPGQWPVPLRVRAVQWVPLQVQVQLPVSVVQRVLPLRQVLQAGEQELLRVLQLVLLRVPGREPLAGLRLAVLQVELRPQERRE